MGKRDSINFHDQVSHAYSLGQGRIGEQRNEWVADHHSLDDEDGVTRGAADVDVVDPDSCPADHL